MGILETSMPCSEKKERCRDGVACVTLTFVVQLYGEVRTRSFQ